MSSSIDDVLSLLIRLETGKVHSAPAKMPCHGAKCLCKASIALSQPYRSGLRLCKAGLGDLGLRMKEPCTASGGLLYMEESTFIDIFFSSNTLSSP